MFPCGGDGGGGGSYLCAEFVSLRVVVDGAEVGADEIISVGVASFSLPSPRLRRGNSKVPNFCNTFFFLFPIYVKLTSTVFVCATTI